MEENTISLLISVVALIIAILSFFKSKDKPELPVTTFNSVPLQLQAYERLVLLCERIALPNLVSRINQPQFTAKEMQVLLLDNIKQEYEYNASQQIYVTPAAWEGVRNLRDQNMLVINKIANILPPDARASDLNKQLLEVIISQSNAALHTIVLDSLNVEAKKLMPQIPQKR